MIDEVCVPYFGTVVQDAFTGIYQACTALDCDLTAATNCINSAGRPPDRGLRSGNFVALVFIPSGHISYSVAPSGGITSLLFSVTGSMSSTAGAISGGSTDLIFTNTGHLLSDGIAVASTTLTFSAIGNGIMFSI